jgi:hypothetical protein
MFDPPPLTKTANVARASASPPAVAAVAEVDGRPARARAVVVPPDVATRRARVVTGARRIAHDAPTADMTDESRRDARVRL